MFRSFAVVPAAGRSERMGTPKLLLPLGGRPIIDHVLAAWTASGVTRTVVVARADDALLIERCRLFDVDLVTPASPPPDMRASVELALAHIAERYAPSNNDAWLVAPADQPRLAPSVIDMVLHAYKPNEPVAIAPVHRGERGHPTLLPWSTAREVRSLADGEGVNALVAHTPLREIGCLLPAILDDLDAPADYARLAAEWRPLPMAKLPARRRGFKGVLFCASPWERLIMPRDFSLNVNGRSHAVTTDDDRLLLDVLREDLGLTGTKYGCGEGECGACTVIVDGAAVRSCITRVGEVSSSKIRTIEGLATGNALHPVQQAFIDQQAMQCGYCVPGQIMAAAALLEGNKKPSRNEVVAAMTGNICRCCNYCNILAAVEQAAGITTSQEVATAGTR